MSGMLVWVCTVQRCVCICYLPKIANMWPFLFTLCYLRRIQNYFGLQCKSQLNLGSKSHNNWTFHTDIILYGLIVNKNGKLFKDYSKKGQLLRRLGKHSKLTPEVDPKVDILYFEVLPWKESLCILSYRAVLLSKKKCYFKHVCSTLLIFSTVCKHHINRVTKGTSGKLIFIFCSPKFPASFVQKTILSPTGILYWYLVQSSSFDAADLDGLTFDKL